MGKTTQPAGGNVANIYIGASLKAASKSHAKEQYGMSLSELIQKLLVKEMSLKRGLLGKKEAA